MRGWLLIETLLVLPLANAIVWRVAALWSTGDVAPAVHNFGCEDNSS
jgi:hypothetical protein